MNPIFPALIKGGKVVVKNIGDFNNYLRPLEGREVEVVVRIPRKDRTNPQNKYYWSVIIKLLCEHTGYTDSEMHDALRMLFLRDMSREVPTIKSTTSLSTVEFESYMSNIRVWASQDLKVYLPEPNEVELNE